MSAITGVVFDTGNLLIRRHPDRAPARHLPDRAAARARFDRTGFCDWNLDQDRGRPLAAALPVLAARGLLRARLAALRPACLTAPTRFRRRAHAPFHCP